MLYVFYFHWPRPIDNKYPVVGLLTTYSFLDVVTAPDFKRTRPFLINLKADHSHLSIHKKKPPTTILAVVSLYLILNVLEKTIEFHVLLSNPANFVSISRQLNVEDHAKVIFIHTDILYSVKCNVHRTIMLILIVRAYLLNCKG